MSTQISTSEGERVANTYNYRRSKFVRSASLERIKKFNTYICSQNYYILPAILAWLKSSQHIFHANLKKCIESIKSEIFDNYIYKTMDSQCKCFYNTIFYPALTNYIDRLHKATLRLYTELKLNLFGAMVYLTITAIFTQLLILLIILSTSMMPGGLIFMITCMVLITHVNYVCLNSTLDKKAMKKQLVVITSNNNNIKRLSRRDLLTKRTISNINFF